MRYLYFILILAGVIGCKTDKAEVEKVTDPVSFNEEIGTNVDILYTEKGIPSLRIRGPRMKRTTDLKPVTEFSEGVLAEIYNETGTIETVLTSKYAISDETKKEILARDSVVVVNIEGERLETEELIWDQTAQKIYSDQFVKITTADEIIIGHGMEADESFTNYTVKKITGVINVEEDAINEDD